MMKPVLVLLVLVLAGCGGTKTVTVTQSRTTTVREGETTTVTAARQRPPASKSKTGVPRGSMIRSGGVALAVVKVRFIPSIHYLGNAYSSVTPNGEARTVPAGSGARFVSVTTKGTNDTKAGIDLTCGAPVIVTVVDKLGRHFDPIDGLSQIAGNPECNANTQPGFGFRMTWIFRIPSSARPVSLQFEDATDLNHLGPEKLLSLG